MTKTQTINLLNEKIDKLIITGIKTKEQKEEYKRLCKLHTNIRVEHKPVKFKITKIK